MVPNVKSSSCSLNQQKFIWELDFTEAGSISPTKIEQHMWRLYLGPGNKEKK